MWKIVAGSWHFLVTQQTTKQKEHILQPIPAFHMHMSLSEYIENRILLIPIKWQLIGDKSTELRHIKGGSGSQLSCGILALPLVLLPPVPEHLLMAITDAWWQSQWQIADLVTWMVSSNGGGKSHENEWFGGTPISGNHHMEVWLVNTFWMR